VGQQGGWVMADTGTYVELVYELLQDTWANIFQQTHHSQTTTTTAAAKKGLHEMKVLGVG